MRQNNNLLPNAHKLVTWHYGENYTFNGCMKQLMEYVEPNEMYSYNFFAGIGGDCFVQVYGHDFSRYHYCVSVVWDSAEFVGYIFDRIGYAHTYVTAEQIAANKMMYLETVKAYIDRGIPVILKNTKPDNPNHQLIVGYEENGKVLLFLDGDTPDPLRLETDGDILQDWIFIGEKKAETDFERIFKNAFSHIADLLVMDDRYECSFGVKAFKAWADDIVNGRFDGVTPEQFDPWRDYEIYVCNFATNFCGVPFGFLKKAKEVLPEVEAFEAKYREMNDEYEKTIKILQDLNGNFNVTLEALQNKDKRAKIAAEIRKFAAMYAEWAALLKTL